jgi:hypothetical protein
VVRPCTPRTQRDRTTSCPHRRRSLAVRPGPPTRTLELIRALIGHCTQCCECKSGARLESWPSVVLASCLRNLLESSNAVPSARPFRPGALKLLASESPSETVLGPTRPQRGRESPRGPRASAQGRRSPAGLRRVTGSPPRSTRPCSPRTGLRAFLCAPRDQGGWRRPPR